MTSTSSIPSLPPSPPLSPSPPLPLSPPLSLFHSSSLFSALPRSPPLSLCFFFRFFDLVVFSHSLFGFLLFVFLYLSLSFSLSFSSPFSFRALSFAERGVGYDISRGKLLDTHSHLFVTFLFLSFPHFWVSFGRSYPLHNFSTVSNPVATSHLRLSNIIDSDMIFWLLASILIQWIGVKEQSKLSYIQCHYGHNSLPTTGIERNNESFRILDDLISIKFYWTRKRNWPSCHLLNCSSTEISTYSVQ